MSPPAAPRIFDRALIRDRLSRARAAGPATFLLDRAADDLVERLGTVRRGFPLALDLGSPGARAAAALASCGQVERALRAAPIADAGASLVADEALPPFRDGAFELVVSLMALHRVDDLPGALARIRRILKPDGLFIACLPGGRTLRELRTALAIAESETTGGASPRVEPFADLRDLGQLLQRAGFALPVADLDALVVRYADAFALMADLRAMGATNGLIERSRRPLRRDVLTRAAAIYAERFADSDGRLRATFEFVWLSGWAPHESQRKPLAPGSARMRLADALGARSR